MIRVSAKQPCPICGKPDWCLVAEDGTKVICQRIESPQRIGDAGWLHTPNEPVNYKTPFVAKNGPIRKEWTSIAARFAANPKPPLSLGLPDNALDRIPLIGWCPMEQCHTFPEVCDAGKIIGISRRFANGTKKSMFSSRRGLTLPTDWQEMPGTIFVVEGPTDAAAMIASGLCAIGRPSNSGGFRFLRALLERIPDRCIVVVGENDQKPNGLWPGKSGADMIANLLMKYLKRPVKSSLPPPTAKDVRAWLTSSERGPTSWRMRGRQLATFLDPRLPPPAGPKPGPGVK